MNTDLTISTPRDIGLQARAARRQMGLSQEALAGLCHVGTRFISDLENGKATLQIGKALEVLRALGLFLQIRSGSSGSPSPSSPTVTGLLANFRKVQRKSVQSEARTNLSGLATSMKSYFGEHNAYPKTFARARWELPGPTRYAYFLSPQEVLGGDKYPDREELLREARKCFKALRLRPIVRQHSFLAAAFAIHESPQDVDLWTIDERGTLANLPAAVSGNRD